MNKASRLQILFRLRIHGALPFFMAGLRISSGLSLIGAVVAEFVAGTGGNSAGLAYQILQASFQLDIPRMFAALALITVTCEDVLRSATAGGAEILGLPAIGTLAVGQAADIAIFDLSHPRYAGLHDPLIAPIASGAAHPRHVLVAGRPVVVNGEIPGLDLAQLTARAAAVGRRLNT
jgi:cytosine/adenosine deaminase-related metal-dependent hydrolase